MKIFDCFIFFNEFDLLDMRLKYLNDYVDYFVIVEGDHTFSGKPKELLLKDYKFPIDRKKIIYLECKITEPHVDWWTNEDAIRNYLHHGIMNYDENDIIILSDIDEIPNKEVLNKSLLANLKDFDTLSFKQDFFYYYYNLQSSDIWHGTQLVRLKQFLRSYRPERVFSWIRSQRDDIYDYKDRPNWENSPFKSSTIEIPYGGWHFSYLGNPKDIQYKIQSFSHKEYSEISLEQIENAVNNKVDLFGRDINYTKIEIKEFPKELSQYFKDEWILK